MSEPESEAAPEAGEPEWLSHVLTGLVAGLLSVLGGGSLALAAFYVFAQAPPRRLPDLPRLLAMLSIGGLVAGVAWGCAAALATSGRIQRGILALGLGGALSVLAARYAHALEGGLAPNAANAEFLRIGFGGMLADSLFGIGAGLALAGPLLAVRVWGLRSPAQAFAQAIALLLWLPGIVLWPWHFRVSGFEENPEVAWKLLHLVSPMAAQELETSTVVALALVFWCVQALGFPLCLDLVEPRVRRLLVRAGLEGEPAPRVSGAPARLRRRIFVLVMELLLIESSLGVFTVCAAMASESLDATTRRRELRAKAEAGDSDAMGELGLQLAKSGDREGVAWVERAARLGDERALWSLGRAAESGLLGDLRYPYDLSAALEWYAKVKGGSSAFEDLALRRPDLPGARAWRESEIARLTSAASTGAPAACGDLGSFYDRIGEPDLALAAYAKAAASDPAWMLTVAEVLMSRKRPNDAAVWLERAAAGAGKSASQAAERRGELAAQGLLGDSEKEKASEWYERAAELQAAPVGSAATGGPVVPGR